MRVHTHMHTHLSHWHGTDATLTSYTAVTHLWEQFSEYRHVFFRVPCTTIAHFAYNLLTISFGWHSLSVYISFHSHCVQKKAGTFKLDINMLEDLLTVQEACQNCSPSCHVAHSSDLLEVLHKQCNATWPTVLWNSSSYTSNHSASNPTRLSLRQFKILLFLGTMMQFLCTNWRNQNFLIVCTHEL